MNYVPLTDEQWLRLESCFEEPAKRGRGKPHTPWRSVVNSILFVLTTGSKWEALPKSPEFASKSAAHRWFLLWDKNGFIEQMLALLNGMSETPSEFQFPPRRNRKPRVQECVEAPVMG